MKALVIAACASAACGRVRFVDHDAAEGIIIPDVALDAPIARCQWTPSHVAAGALEANLDVPGFTRGQWLSSDGLETVWSNDSGSGPQLFRADRAALDQPFGVPVIVPDFAGHPVYGIAYAADDLYAVMFFTDDLYESSRASITDVWSPPVLITSLSSAKSDQFPWLSPDGNSLWFNRAGSVQTDQTIYVTSRKRRGDPWPPAIQVPELVDPAHESFHPSLDISQRTILFASTRGTKQIGTFYATRADIGATWSVPQELDLRTDALNQADPALSNDGCSIVFGSPPGTTDAAWHVWSTSTMP